MVFPHLVNYLKSYIFSSHKNLILNKHLSIKMLASNTNSLIISHLLTKRQNPQLRSCLLRLKDFYSYILGFQLVLLLNSLFIATVNA